MTMFDFVRRRPAPASVGASLVVGAVVLGSALDPPTGIAVALVLVLAAFVAVPALALRGVWRVAGGLAGALAFVVVLLVVVRIRYGGGARYPDLSTEPVIPAAALESLVQLDYPPGNVALSADGRIFFAYHPFAQAHRFTPATVFELVDGRPQPFPDQAFQVQYQGVFGMTVDRQNRLWLIEPASLDHERTRLLAIDLQSRASVFEHRFPAGEARFAQDLRVAPDGNTIYLADTGLFRFTPASLLVFDVATRKHRQVLAGHDSTRPQDWAIQTAQGPHKLAFGLLTFTVGIDGIELSADGAWLYYGAMSHDRLFKVPTEALRDPALSPDDLARQIVAVGKKPLSDGITLERDGSVLITDIEHGGIARLDAAGKLTTLMKSPRVIWADGVVLGADGAVVFTDSAIPAYIDPLARPPARERLAGAAPYHLYRFRLPAGGAAQ
jgi:sugar lactone lactonase YvrE